MASFTQVAGNGATTVFAVPFPYLEESHVGVSVNGVDTAFSFLTPSTISVTPAPAAASIVDIRRTTPIDTSYVDFVDGSVLLERDLDLVATWLRYVCEENRDQAMIVNTQGAWEGATRRLSNLADPVAAQDAATRAYVLAVASGSVSTVDSPYSSNSLPLYTGQWITTPERLTGTPLPISGITISADRAYFLPIRVEEDTPLSRIGWFASRPSSGATTMKFAIYSADPTRKFYPLTRLFGPYTADPIPAFGSGLFEAWAVATGAILPAGELVWIAMWSDDGAGGGSANGASIAGGETVGPGLFYYDYLSQYRSAYAIVTTDYGSATPPGASLASLAFTPSQLFLGSSAVPLVLLEVA